MYTLQPTRSLLLLLSLAAVAAPSLTAQRGGSSEPRFDPSLYRALEFRLVGPYRGGRVTAVAGVRHLPHTYYMGSTGGGVWRSDDGGERWVNISDGQFASASVGAIAVAPSDRNVLYVGMGSACIRHNVSPGDGMYKSMDGGRTWRHIGLDAAGHISQVRVHPTDPDIVYVAVLGHAFGPNPERGVFRSQDGGATWEHVLYVSDGAGAADLAMDPSNPRILYAAIWEAVRQPWTVVSGGEDSGLYKSVDGGNSWAELTEGLPTGIKGRIGVVASPANPDRVWALVEADEGGLYRSDDGAQSFRLINDDPVLTVRAFYYTHLVADPVDEHTVYSMAQGDGFFKSVDGGETFESIPAPHGDHHALWINPDNPENMVNGNDGGAAVTYNGGRSWSTIMNQPTSEVFTVSTDNRFLYRLYGAQQDNSTISIASRTTSFGITERDWHAVGGGEQGEVTADPRNPNIVFSGNYEGIIERYDHSTGQARNVQAYPQFGEGQKSRNYKYRFAVLAPIRFSPHDPGVLYHASNFVHRSRDDGHSWEVISPDLTRDDVEKQGVVGGPIGGDYTGVEVYGAILALEESPITPGLLWAGSDDGLVHISRDGGQQWEDVTPPDLPLLGTVSTIELSAREPGRAIVAVHRYRLDDFAPYIFRTNDYGDTWELLTDGSNGIPPDHFVRVVREDPDRSGLLYAGGEFGLYVSFDDGENWRSFQLNLPVTPVMDIAVHRKDLAIATQGRSFWILDDLTPLHGLTDDVARASTHLYESRDAYRLDGGSGQQPRVGTNPPNGVIVYYQLGQVPQDEVTLEFLDAAGEVVRTFSSASEEVPVEAGLNRFIWDTRYEGSGGAGGYSLRSTPGPKAVPGTYRIRLRVGSWSATRSFEYLKDPRIETTQAELQEQFDLAIRIRNRVTETHSAVRAIRDVRDQLEDLVQRAATDDPDHPIAAAARTLDEAITAVEEMLTQIPARRFIFVAEPRLGGEFGFLYSTVTGSDTRPTAAAYERLADLESQLSEQLGTVRNALASGLPALNALAREHGIGVVVAPPL